MRRLLSSMSRVLLVMGPVLLLGLCVPAGAARAHTITSAAPIASPVLGDLTDRRGRVHRGRVHHETTAEQETAGATIAGAAIAFLAFVGAVLGLAQNRLAARRRLTYELVGRLEDLDLIAHQALLSSFLRGGLRPPDVPQAVWATMSEQARLDSRVDTWQQISESSTTKDRETVLRMLAFPNMLEALAGMYNQGLLDRAIVKTRGRFASRRS
jgi:hypothetical protein